MSPWEGLAFPKAIRQLPAAALPALCAALKQHMQAHAAPEEALSAVALTVALHRVFRTPYEVLLFEKASCAWAHRLLTGQRRGGLSPVSPVSPVLPAQAQALPHPADIFDTCHGPAALAHAQVLLEARARTHHPGKAVVVLDEKRPLHKESFAALSQPQAASLPWVLLLARTSTPTHADSFLCAEALAEFFGSLGFGLWPMLECGHMEAVEAVLRQAKAAHKVVVVHVRLP